MAIQAGWVGSSAVSETGQRWMSAAMQAVRLGRPAYMSAMVGRSKEIHYSIGASNSYNKDTLINWMKAQGSTPVVITITGNIVSQSTGVPCLDFPSSLTNEYVTLIINSGVTVYGRGGNGGSNAAGAAGGNAINNAIGTRLRITNNGAIAGGGGGGGGGNRGRLVFGGGGGRPFGAAGSSSNMGSGATAGSISAPGKGSVGEGSLSAYTGGAGGNVGAAGGRCNTQGNGTEYNGGAAGKAVTGNAPRWDKVGTIYGARV
ncbi:TPA: receptor-recognizing protein [Escherichia coli]|nr:receptor-recognizing protein [Escherichia coli]HCX7760478.1 receptor-recognizing protein [Escherichia coli]